jgi:hypothetical protein
MKTSAFLLSTLTFFVALPACQQDSAPSNEQEKNNLSGGSAGSSAGGTAGTSGNGGMGAPPAGAGTGGGGGQASQSLSCADALFPNDCSTGQSTTSPCYPMVGSMFRLKDSCAVPGSSILICVENPPSPAEVGACYRFVREDGVAFVFETSYTFPVSPEMQAKGIEKVGCTSEMSSASPCSDSP